MVVYAVRRDRMSATGRRSQPGWSRAHAGVSRSVAEMAATPCHAPTFLAGGGLRAGGKQPGFLSMWLQKPGI